MLFWNLRRFTGFGRQNEVVSAAKENLPLTGSVVDGDAQDGARAATTIERTLALVGDRWTILILRAAFRGIRRFDEFCGDLGIARPMLTRRLRKLVGAGLMTRDPYQQHPARFEYRLTSLLAWRSPPCSSPLCDGAMSISQATRPRQSSSTRHAAQNSSRASGVKPVPPCSGQALSAAPTPTADFTR